MKIDVTRLSEDRELEFFEEWDPKVYDLDGPGISYIGRLGVRAFARKESGIVILRVEFKAKMHLTCARCQKDFSRPIDKTLKLIYPLGSGLKVIPLDNNIREELILTYPHKILCQQECRGLCPRCGVDLNEEKCKCKAD